METGLDAFDPVFFPLGQDGFKVLIYFDQVHLCFAPELQAFTREDALQRSLVDLYAEFVPHSALKGGPKSSRRRRASIFSFEPCS
jgi:hypothetical protein